MAKFNNWQIWFKRCITRILKSFNLIFNWKHIVLHLNTGLQIDPQSTQETRWRLSSAPHDIWLNINRLNTTDSINLCTSLWGVDTVWGYEGLVRSLFLLILLLIHCCTTVNDIDSLRLVNPTVCMYFFLKMNIVILENQPKISVYITLYILYILWSICFLKNHLIKNSLLFVSTSDVSGFNCGKNRCFDSVRHFLCVFRK